MKKSLLILLVLYIVAIPSYSVELTQGKISVLRQTQGDIYFRLDIMPADVNWFFMNPTASGPYGVCERSAPGEDALNRMFSQLLSAKLAKSGIQVAYCKQGAYGLITTPGGFVESQD